MPVRTRARMDQRRSGALVIVVVIVVVVVIVIVVVIIVVLGARRRQRNDGLLWRCRCWRFRLGLRCRGSARLRLFRGFRLGGGARAGRRLLGSSRWGRRRGGGAVGGAARRRRSCFFEDEPFPEVLVRRTFQGLADSESAKKHDCDYSDCRKDAAQSFLSHVFHCG